MRNAPLRIFVAVLLLIQPWKGGLPDLHPQNLMELGLQLKLELAATNGSSASVLHIRCSRRVKMKSLGLVWRWFPLFPPWRDSS